MAGRESRKFTRVTLKEPLNITIGSIGSDVRYDLGSRDVSTNGLFLDFEKPGRFPFNSSSIMEVWVDLKDGKTLFFNGKVARVVMPDDPQAKVSGPGIGIRIIQITPEQQQVLTEFVASHPEQQQHYHEENPEDRFPHAS